MPESLQFSLMLNEPNGSRLSNNRLAELRDYVDCAWISDDTWAPTVWSVYGRNIRTINDIKG
jgi:hypothetical protein